MIILFDWSGTLSMLKKSDLLNGEKIINKKLIPFIKCNRIGIVSNTSKNAHQLTYAVKKEFKRLKMEVDVQVYNTMFPNGDMFRKPSPWMIWYALHKMGVEDYKEVMYVGDKESDKKAALCAGVGFIYTDTLLKFI